MKFQLNRIRVLALPTLIAVFQANAQSAISIDAAAIRHMRNDLNGLNLSVFYHFSERITGGLEMNRFFPARHPEEEKMIELSAWDFDLNFHYLFPIGKILRLYPLTGISHTSETEKNSAHPEEVIKENFWSYNTGAGLLVQFGNWGPHVEYSYTWGHLNQQFLLAGISYEIRWGKERDYKK